MSIVLPDIIAAYFAAESSDDAAVAGCFGEQAMVKDEGRTHTGRAAIAAWKAEASARFNYTSTPIAVAQEDGHTIVTCHLVGDFPVSPIDLRHFFRIEGDSIAALEIRP
jgi:hypothetical protein